ncbi:hypothetical protein JW851_04605 [Candidatus Woesearchaeota archaeon]|nr:hypothetical protein [Candidatus Woesearchaeota archaeon]
MLKKPKLTILSILIIAMLAAVPLISAFDDAFDEFFTEDSFFTEDGDFIFEDDPDFFVYYPEDESLLYDEPYDDLFIGDPFEDPMIFDDSFDVPGDDMPEMAPQDIPLAHQPEEQPPVIIREKGLSIQITGTRMPDEINAGDQLLLRIYLKNNGKENLDNLKITLVNQELALRRSVGPMDLKKGDKETEILLLDFPYDTESGYYYLRINVHANGIDRVIYRDIYVR